MKKTISINHVISLFCVANLFFLCMFLQSMDQRKARKRQHGDGLAPSAKRVKVARDEEKKQDLRFIQQLPKKLNIVPKIPEGAGVIRSLSPDSNAEYLNIDTEEPLVARTFKELIKEKEKKGEIFFLAVVSMQGSKEGMLYHNYYEATGLNSYLFKYSKINPSLYLNVSLQGKKDPYLRLPIKDINYFYLKNSKQPHFHFFASDAMLVPDDKEENLYQYQLLSNQDLNKIAKADALSQLAFHYEMKGKIDTAIGLYSRAMEYDEDKDIQVSAWIRLASLYEKDNQIGEAKKMLTLVKNQSFSPIHSYVAQYNLGVLEDKSAEQLEAKNNLLRYITTIGIEPITKVLAQTALLKIYKKEDKSDQVKSMLHKLSIQDINMYIRLEAQQEYIQYLLKEENYADAVIWLKQLAKQNINKQYKQDALFELGKIYIINNQVDEAIKVYKELVSSEIENIQEVFLLVQLGELFIKKTNHDKAIDYYLNALSKISDETESDKSKKIVIYAKLVRSYAKKRDYEKANAYLSNIISSLKASGALEKESNQALIKELLNIIRKIKSESFNKDNVSVKVNK